MRTMMRGPSDDSMTQMANATVSWWWCQCLTRQGQQQQCDAMANATVSQWWWWWLVRQDDDNNGWPDREAIASEAGWWQGILHVHYLSCTAQCIPLPMSCQIAQHSCMTHGFTRDGCHPWVHPCYSLLTILTLRSGQAYNEVKCECQLLFECMPLPFTMHNQLHQMFIFTWRCFIDPPNICIYSKSIICCKHCVQSMYCWR